MQDPNQIAYFAQTDARNKRIPFGIKADDRSRHMYVIGKTGMGKSTLLENLAVQDIKNGNGMCFIDPHGKTADLLLEYVPEERIDDVLYFAPFDTDHPISFNVMEDVGYDKRHLVVSGLMSSFKKIWQDAWSARMEYILSNALLALLEYPDSTLLSVSKMLADKKFREKVVDNITDVSVKSFWVDEFAKYTERFAAEATPAIQNKIGQFTANPLIRNIIGQPKSSFDLRQLMDDRKIVIINLSKGRIGELNAQLLGSMLVTKIYLAAMSRADVGDEGVKKLPNFYLFVDEFQSFANESFADILSEARKYKLNLTITHQYIEQMPEEVRAAVFGNVGTLVSFRVGATDAEYLEKEFSPVFTADDLVNLGFTQIYLRLMIDGIGSSPFSASTLPPIAKPEYNYVRRIIDASRQQFARPREVVEEQIKALIEEGRDEAPQNNGSAKKKKKKGGEQSGTKQQKTKPMLDDKAKKELEAALAAKRALKEETPDEPDSDVEDESLSLQNLTQQKRQQKDDPKRVSSENRDGLKAALAAALGASAANEQAAPPKKPEQQMPPKKEDSQTLSQQTPPQKEEASAPPKKDMSQQEEVPKASNEVSADELKKILETR